MVAAAAAPAAARRPSPKPEVLHPRLQEVLPGLAAPAADWRKFTPRELTVSPIPGVAIRFVAQQVTSDGRHTIWTGVSGTPGVTLSSSGTADRWDAIVERPGRPGIRHPHLARGRDRREDRFRRGTVRGRHRHRGAAAGGPAATQALPAAADTTYTSDLLVLYTTAAGSAMGGAAAVDNSVTARIATANTYLAQSQVTNISWHLVGVVEAAGYTETGNLDTDLNNLLNPTTQLGAFASQQGRQYGADQVLLIVSHSDDSFAGEAMTPGSYAVVISTGSAGIVAHELGHNFGCHHDRQTEKAADNDGRYYYGYRWRDASNRDLGTIMSYASFRVPYYSNPALTYQGHILGLAAGDPEAADNARVLRENAAYIANMRPPRRPPGDHPAARFRHGHGRPALHRLGHRDRSGPHLPVGARRHGHSRRHRCQLCGEQQHDRRRRRLCRHGQQFVGQRAELAGDRHGQSRRSTPPPPASSGATSGGGGGGGALDPLVALALALLLVRALAAEPAGARRPGR